MGSQARASTGTHALAREAQPIILPLPARSVEPKAAPDAVSTTQQEPKSDANALVVPRPLQADWAKRVCEDPKAFHELPPALKADERFVAELVRSNINVAKELDKLPVKDSPTVQAAISSMSAAMDELELRCHERYNETREVLRNRYAVSANGTRAKLEQLLGREYFAGVDQDKRPTAVCMTMDREDDAVGAFNRIPSQSTVVGAYRLLCYEPHNPRGMLCELEQATAKRGVKAEVLWLRGHGEPGELALSGTGPGRSFGLRDLALAERLKHCVADGGLVILESCSTGKGAERTPGIDNLAEFVHAAVPQARVVAPTEDAFSKFNDLQFSADKTKITGMRYSCPALVLEPMTAGSIERWKTAAAQPEFSKQDALKMVEHFGGLLQYAPHKFLNDPEVVLAACRQYPAAYQYADPKVLEDRQFALKLMQLSPEAIGSLDERLKSDPEVILSAVQTARQKDGLSIFRVLDHCDPKLLSDRGFAVKLCSLEPYACQRVDESLFKDKVFVADLAKSSPKAALIAGNFDLIPVAQYNKLTHELVANDGSLLQYVAETDDPKLVRSAVKSCPEALVYADKALFKDRELIDELTKAAGRNLFSDPAFATELARRNPEGFFASRERIPAETFRSGLKRLLETRGFYLSHCTEEERADRELVTAAVSNSYKALDHASAELQADTALRRLAEDDRKRYVDTSKR